MIFIMEKPGLDIENILAIVSLVLVLAGGFFGYIQWRKANIIKRAEFINQIIEKLRFDKEMVETLYKFDYDDSWYDAEFHNKEGSELERKIDQTLSYLSYICYLKDAKILQKNDFLALEYVVTRACQSKNVQAYLWNLYHFSKKVQTKCAFHDVIEYGLKNKLFSEKFKEDKVDLYPKYL